MQLRKVCNHPYSLPGSEPGFDGEATGEEVVQASGKLVVLDKLLRKLKAGGHRVVLFSQFVMILDILEDYLSLRGYRFIRLDGNTGRARRAIELRVFNAPSSPIFVYLMSTKAGGLGINAQTADTCILFDSDWNPQVDMQAMARVHRIGQTKKVHVYRLITRGTVEERIILRAEKKLYLDKMVNRDSTQQASQYEKLGKQEMMAMLKFGAHAVFGADDDGDIEGDGAEMYTDDVLDGIIDRTTDWTADQAVASTAAQAAGGSSTRAGAGVQSPRNNAQHTAETFRAEQVPLDFRRLHAEAVGLQKGGPGAPTSLRSIGKEWELLCARTRQRVSTTVMVDGHVVKKANAYTIQGDAYVYGEAADTKKQKKTLPGPMSARQRAGVDYEHDAQCQICWDGGDLVCCDFCCCTYHEACLAARGFPAPPDTGMWSCPHHSCNKCGRGSASAGGLLLRCTECPVAYCDDCEPDGTVLNTGQCERFVALGMRPPPQAYYMQCSARCFRFHNTRVARGIEVAIKEALAAPPPASPDSKAPRLKTEGPMTPAAPSLTVPAPRRVTEPPNARKYAGKVVDFDGCHWAVARENDTLLAVAAWCGWKGDPRAFLFQNKDVPGISLRAKLQSGTCLLMDQKGVSPVVGTAAFEDASAKKRARVRLEREAQKEQKKKKKRQQRQQGQSP